MKHPTSETFPQNVQEALGDTTLRRALSTVSATFSQRRRDAVNDVPEWETLRDHAHAVKEHTLSRLDEYLQAFAVKAEAAGAHMHWASTAEEARGIITDLIKPLGNVGVVKSKSMTTEEIHLNAELETHGIEPVETDLGEWIIQLADEPPSHIIAPAIHKTKRQVSELFEQQLGIEPTDDEERLTAAAREHLRDVFARAKVGISGVNFAIAETGSIVIIENEGNARLTTSLPDMHIAVMGIEKVIPRLRDLDVFLRILPRSGTGQALTSYQSIITGPERGDRIGPRSLHIVVLDNGRSKMLREHATREALACIRCGACLNACPVYQQIGGHAYGAVYAGPIGSVITPQIDGFRVARHLPFASSLCGACRDVCPVKIDIPNALIHLRKHIVSHGQPAPIVSPVRAKTTFRAWRWSMTSDLRYRMVIAFARFAQRMGVTTLLGPSRKWGHRRSVPRIAKKDFRQIWASELADDREHQTK